MFATTAVAVTLTTAAAATGDFADIPALKARVTDTTGTLSAADVARIEGKLKDFEQKKGSQIVVLMVPTTQPEAIEQYSIRVAEAWKIGRKKIDDGLILLVAKNDRKMRIEVGYGLEGAIPDATAKRIISEVIAPRFRANDYAGGVEAGADRLIAVASGEALPAPAQKKTWSVGDTARDSGINLEWFMVAFFVAVGVGGFLAAVFGRFFGGVLTGGGLGAVAWFISGALGTGFIIGFIAFIVVLIFGGRGGGGISTGGWSSGSGGSSDWSGSDSFSGGGGDFGGGGASGDW
ncbi:MAG: YgcG family protein [Betaproteobacteria bacterium]|nr:YgcG family protein [Betaproteobacteria bacterium]